MQAWSIRKDIATAVPKDKLLILDLNGAKFKSKENFWGYNFIAGNLHNFGGRINMHGDLKLLASNQFKKVQKKAPNVIGTGLFMESIIQNPVYYDLAFEMGLRSDKVNIQNWLKKYTHRRYGAKSDNAEKAWQILLNTAYKTGTNGVERSSIICARPAIDVKKSGPNAGFNIPYSNADLVKALKLLLKDADKLKQPDAYTYDIVNTARQALSNLGQNLHKKAMTAYKNKDRKQFKYYSNMFLGLLRDTDTLLYTRKEFRFDQWVKHARNWGKTKAEKDLYEYNASMLVTIWGPPEAPTIFDYSWREWSGLIGQYYLVRWQKFYNMLDKCLIAGKPYTEKNLPMVYGRQAFRANKFYSDLADWELSWIKSTKTFPKLKMSDAVTQTQKLTQKYFFK